MKEISNGLNGFDFDLNKEKVQTNACYHFPLTLVNSSEIKKHIISVNKMKSAQLFIVTISLIWPSSQINSTKEKRDCFEWGVEYHGGGLDNPMVTGVTSPDSCQSLCQESHT